MGLAWPAMSKKKLFFYVGVFLLSVAAGFTFFRSSNSGTLSSAPELDWRALGEMDYISGAASEDLKKLDGKTVKIPGFMVPLEDNQKLVSQFLLVPSPQACIHVPPPPPNQMVFGFTENLKSRPSVICMVKVLFIWLDLKLNPIVRRFFNA